MLLPVETPLRLVSIRTIEKRNAKDELKSYSFLKLANEATFESEDFMLSSEQSPEGLIHHNRYKVTLNVEGKFTSVMLEPESKKAS